MRRFVLVVCCASAVSAALAETRYFASNSLGMALSPIGWFQLDEHDYVLAVSSEQGKETRVLSRSGSEVETKVSAKTSAGVVEEVFRGGSLEERQVRDSLGRITRQETFSGGILTESARYRYVDGVIAGVDRFDGEGTLVNQDSYRLDRYGKLIAVERKVAEKRNPALSVSSP